MIFNEKRFCILLLVGLAAALACGARGTKRKTVKPAVLLQEASDFQLQDLSLKKKATVVELEYVSPYYYNPDNTKMSFFRRAFLVQEGDTLYKIALRFYGRVAAWRLIRDANKTQISNDGRVRAGQTSTLP